MSSTVPVAPIIPIRAVVPVNPWSTPPVYPSRPRLTSSREHHVEIAESTASSVRCYAALDGRKGRYAAPLDPIRCGQSNVRCYADRR